MYNDRKFRQVCALVNVAQGGSSDDAAIRVTREEHMQASEFYNELESLFPRDEQGFPLIPTHESGLNILHWTIYRIQDDAFDRDLVRVAVDPWSSEEDRCAAIELLHS